MDSSPALGLTQPQAAQYLRQLLEALPVGVVTVDAEGRVQSWNSRATEILDAPPSPAVSVYSFFEDGASLRELVEDCFRRSRDPLSDVFSTNSPDGALSIEVTARMVSVDESGGGPVAMLLLQDATRRIRAEQRLKQTVQDRDFLARVGIELAQSLDYHVTLRHLARLVVGYLADWCAINVVEEDGSIKRVAVAHSDPSKELLIGRLQDMHPHDPKAETGVPLVLRTGSSQLHSVVDTGLLERTAHNPEYLEIVQELGLRSNMIVPIRAHGETIGTLSFVSAREDLIYDEAHLELAEELGRRSGLAVYNSRLFHRVRESERRFATLARTLQSSLLPPELPTVPGFDVAALYRAAAQHMDVGGDFYDIFEAGEGDWGLVMGDVQGHGAQAASVTALARYTLRAVALRLRRPMHALYQVNRALLRQSKDERFLSAVFARLSPGRQPRVTISNGGHPEPMVMRADGSVESIACQGMLLGLFQAPDLNERVIELAPGETLVLFTDGVVEAGAPRNMLGEEGLRQLLARCRGMSAQQIVTAIDEMLLTWQDEAGHRDDCAVLVVRSNRERDQE